MTVAQVLGIGVDESLVEQWRGWFAPEVQPFRVDLLPPRVAAGIPIRTAQPSPEWRDTFFMYGGTWSWFSEAEFAELRPGQRRSLMAARRRAVRPKSMPVWPSQLARSGDAVVFDWVASSVRASRHADVTAKTWSRAVGVLPASHRLAGTFPRGGSGPNCFGTVMAASGVAEADRVQVDAAHFRAWLSESTDPVAGTGRDHEPGTVFAWTEAGELAHAAVTIGDGWMLSKPSQSWSSPSLIWTVAQTVNSWRLPNTHLSRHRLRGLTC